MTRRSGNFNGYLADVRKNRENSKPFAVKSLNKDGAVSRVTDFQRFSTEAEALVCRERMENLNPGRKFVVVAV